MFQRYAVLGDFEQRIRTARLELEERIRGLRDSPRAAVEALEDLDDIQNVYSDFELSEAALAELA